MQASNYRIGNLVDIINRGGKVHLPNNRPMKIWGIDPFEAYLYKPESNPAHQQSLPVFSIRDICGLKLTEERLIQLGFKKVGINYEIEWLLLWTNKQTGSIDFAIYEAHSNRRKITQMKYVHQLQNLYFALTGEELEYNLKKS